MKRGDFMSYYLLTDTVQPCTEEELFSQTDNKYVAVLTTSEWARDRERFDMGIELDLDARDIHNTKAGSTMTRLRELSGSLTVRISDQRITALRLRWTKRASCLLMTAARQSR